MRFRDRKKDVVIVCPNCGREYLPAEIYVPNAFFGKPYDIDRYENGEIEVYDGTSMDLMEEYTCDYCQEKFVVKADIKFRTSKKKDEKLNPVYVSQLVPNRISLFEDIGSTDSDKN